MGCGGEDVQLSKAARARFPYTVECKNVEKLNVWGAYEQCQNSVKKKRHRPLLCIKKNRARPLIVVDAAHFFALVRSNFIMKQELDQKPWNEVVADLPTRTSDPMTASAWSPTAASPPGPQPSPSGAEQPPTGA